MSSVRSATSAAHRVPSHAGPNPRATGAPFHVGAAAPDSQHCRRPVGSLAHSPHSSHRAASPQMYITTMVLLHHRPCRMIAESGTPARARATRPAWLETALFPAMAVNPHSP